MAEIFIFYVPLTDEAHRTTKAAHLGVINGRATKFTHDGIIDNKVLSSSA